MPRPLYERGELHDVNADERYDVLVRKQDGEIHTIELEFVDDILHLRAHDVEAFEKVWELVELLLNRVETTEALSA
jgi:hypothetical protein